MTDTVENKTEQRASTSNKGRRRRVDEGYEEFLALLASSPTIHDHEEMAAATPSLTTSSSFTSTSTSTVTQSVAEEQEQGLRRVSLARGNEDIDFYPPTPTQEDETYFPPSAQAPDAKDSNAGHAANDGYCELFAA